MSSLTSRLIIFIVEDGMKKAPLGDRFDQALGDRI